jgi:ubiquinone/menaquinone biosynthesis C-methylase UbiE
LEELPVTATDRLFSGSIPEIYDRLLAPLIFEPYALDLAERLARTPSLAILETAAGTGVLTRAIASALPAHATIVATDLNAPMLDRASARQADDRRLVWQQADAMTLPFDDGRFDAVVTQFGAMFFPDKLHAYREARRVLKPRGLYLFNVWDQISENQFTEVVASAIAAFFPDDPPDFMARTPHGYHDAKIIRAQLADAGFAEISVTAAEKTSKANSAKDVAIAFCQGTPLRNEIEARDASALEDVTTLVADALKRRFGDGPIEGRIRAFVITAVS